MSLPATDVPNIVPPNNLRLPDALTVKHGPAELLARFVLAGYIAGRDKGVDLRLRHDFDELLYLSKTAVAKQSSFRLMNMFNLDTIVEELTPENSYWIAGSDAHGEIVITQAGRLYDWRGTTLEREARLMFYGGRDLNQRCLITTEAARSITGFSFYGGQGWVRPDFRGLGLSRLFPRLGRAYALSRWPIDSLFSFIAPILVEKGVAKGYGYRKFSPSILYPDTPWGVIEAVLVTLGVEEAYDDFATFLASELSGSAGADDSWSSWIVRDDSVTRISSDGVFQGSSNRS